MFLVSFYFNMIAHILFTLGYNDWVLPFRVLELLALDFSPGIFFEEIKIMSKIIVGLIVTLLGGTTLLYIEYCWFDTKICPFQTSVINSNKIVTNTPCTKTRLVNQQLVDDCQPLNPLSFKINYLYRDGGKGEFRAFGEGSVLHSGDSLKLLFKPTERAYVYIFMVDSHGNIGRLFPTGDFKGASQANRNPVQPGMQYFVPAAHKSFRLDQNTGAESIYFIATRQADEVLEQQSQELFNAQQSQDIETITLIQEQIYIEFKQRLIEPELVTDVAPEEQPTFFEEAGQRFSVLPAYLNNLCEGCVYRVTFQHDQ
jgi:hypothetical protein